MATENNDSSNKSVNIFLFLILSLAFLVFVAWLLNKSDSNASNNSDQEIIGTWGWEKHVNGASEENFSNPTDYVITFENTDTFSAKMDCQTASGTYTASTYPDNPTQGQIKFMPTETSDEVCENPDSRSTDMTNMLAAVQSYQYEDDNNVLIFKWPADGPKDFFRRDPKDNPETSTPEPEEPESGTTNPEQPIPVPTGDNPMNSTYTIDMQNITFVNGKAQTTNAETNETVNYMIWGTPVTGNLNDDSYTDAALIIEQTGQGSGVFYYVAAAMQNENKTYSGTNTNLIGDRVAIQNQLIENKQIVVNYADRAPGEPMTTPPSMGMSKYFIVNPNNFLTEERP